MQPDTPQPQEISPTSPAASEPAAVPAQDDDSVRQVPSVTLSIGDAAIFGAADAADSQAAGVNKTAVPDVVQWSAREYISADKTPLWYAILAVAVVGVVVLDYFVLRTYFTVSLLAIVIVVVFVVMHIRPARMINYTLDKEGLRIDDQLYPLADYKAFGVIFDGKENSVHLIPVKRFRPSLQVYFPVESGEQIVDSLAARLPMEELHLDFVDQIVKMLRL